MRGRTGNFSGGDDSGSTSHTTRFQASPSKFASPYSPRPLASPPPQVHRREINRLGAVLATELQALQADLDYMVDEWHEEMERLEQALGQQGLEMLLDHLQKLDPKQARELRAHADELTGVLATAKVLRQLHRPVKVMQEWDAMSRGLQQALNARDKRQNLLTPREQAAAYYLHSIASLGRAAAFSCYLAGVAGAAIPSLLLAGLIVVPAGVHTTIMVRDHFRSQENYHKSRAQAFENMGRALRGLESWPDCSADDAMAMLCFRDAMAQLPEKSRPAALDAKRAQYAALRDQAFMPVNVLASCIGQILNLVLAPQWATGLLLGLSSAAYFVQGLLDLLQGDVEGSKAEGQSESLLDWLNKRAASAQMIAWAGESTLNSSALIVMQEHGRRSLHELEPERFGAGARQVKGVFNFINGGLSASAATLPAFKLAPRSLATIAGVVASSVSLLYMAATATKVLLRGNVKENARERCRQAQFLLAQMDPAEVLARINQHDGRPVVLEIAHGGYDEFSGFATRRLEVRPWENEYIALEALAEAIDAFALGQAGDDEANSIARIMVEQWNMKALDWVNLLRVAGSMRNPTERVAFIKHRLAGVVKIDFALDADGLEAELPVPVLLQAFLRKLKSEDYAWLEQVANAHDDPESGYGSELKKKFELELLRHGEDSFLAAMEETWAQRKRYPHPAGARVQLQVLQHLAGTLQAQRKQFRDRLLDRLEGDDALLLGENVSALDLKLFVQAVRQWLDAAPKARGERRGALYHLARMQLTQDLLAQPELFARLSCYRELSTVLGLIDVNVGPPVLEVEDLLVSVSSSQSSDSVRVEGEDSESESRNSLIAPSLAQGSGAASLKSSGAGASLLALVKKPFQHRRGASKRASAVLKEVVEQMPANQPGASPARLQPSLLKASPVKGPTYTALQPPQTPLSPRRRHPRPETPKEADD